MFEILDRTGRVVATTDTRPHALRLQTRLETSTLQPHQIHEAADLAAASVRTLSLVDAFVAGEVTWVNDMPVSR